MELERLGKYELLERLGRGGMGEVWKARDTRLDRVVAIKVSREKFSDRFETEARAVAALNHPHIRTLHEGTATAVRRVGATDANSAPGSI